VISTKSISLLLIVTLIACGWLCLFNLPASAETGEQIAPPGFELVRSAGAVALFKKNFTNGSPDYVQVADLSQGAQVHVMYGEIVNPGQGQGVYGGDNPRFNRKTIQQFWHELKSITDGAFCVTNGQFFRLADSPTPLPFPLKQNGQILSDGYGINEFPGQKLMLEIWPDHLDIRELSEASLYASVAPDIVVGLTEDAEKASKKAVGRTFVGIADRDGDQRFETMMIFSTQVSRPAAAADTLRDFGAAKVMMLDGGGSTQLECNGEAYIDTERLIPQAIGLSAGSPPALLAQLAEQPVNAAQVENQSRFQAQSQQNQQDEISAAPVEVVPDPLESAQITHKLAGKVRIGDAAWIPLLMIPIMIWMIFAIRKSQQFQI
jgi:hypothetical protein